MEHGNWDSIWFLREECCEVDVELAAVVILDGSLEGGKGVYMSFLFAPVISSANFIHILYVMIMDLPVELILPICLRILNPLLTHAKLTMATSIL